MKHTEHNERIDALTAERDKLREENWHLMDALKAALAEVTRLKNERRT